MLNTPVPTTVGFVARMLGASYNYGALTANESSIGYKLAGSFNNNVYAGGIDYVLAPQFNGNDGV
jgi:hypothetical protein